MNQIHNSSRAVTIAMPYGPCPAYLMRPEADGPWPAVIFYGDAGGIRPTMVDMAQRLANQGYLVLLPDPFSRFGPYETLVPAEVFKGDVMAILGPLIASTGNDKAAEDAASYLDYLDATGLASEGNAGAVGFCMGGGMAIAAAASMPNRFAAVASFHGGNLATDAPASPHLFATHLKAHVLLACADNDETCPPAMVERFEKVLDHAGVAYETQTYVGAAHGWMVPDFPTYDSIGAKLGWEMMLALFERTLTPVKPSSQGASPPST